MKYEEIISKYPIGMVLKFRHVQIHDTKFYYSPKDIEVYKNKYQSVVTYPNNICECFRTDIVETKVEGWLFDGKEWYVAQDSLDGWIPYSEEELERFEVDRLKKEYWDAHILEF